MKKLLLISIFLTFVNADYLNTKTSNHCIYDLTPYQNNTGWCYKDRSDNSDNCDRFLELDDLVSGYVYESGDCVLSNDLKITGLSFETYTSLQALNGSLFGFTLTFMLSFLFILLGRR